MSIHQLIEIARRSFRVQTAAMNVAGQNIANVNTEGYSRQRIGLQADSLANRGLHTQLGPGTVTGAGVSLQTFERLRDGLLVSAGWEARSMLGSADEEQRILSALEGLMASSEKGALQNVLGEFWNAWADLADHPTDEGVRLAVRSAGENLTLTLNRLSFGIKELADQTYEALAGGITDINKKIDEIARLNATIERARMTGAPDLAAEDKRDLLVKELSMFVPLRVQQEARGGYMVTINGMAVVQGDKTTHLTLSNTSGTPTVEFGTTGVVFKTDPGQNDGRLGAWLRTINTTLPDTTAKLDELARSLVAGVNALHANPLDDAGNPLGTPPVDFFEQPADIMDVNASNIRLSAAVTADHTLIAPVEAFYDVGGKLISMASAIADLRTTNLGSLSTTTESFTIDLASAIGQKIHQASSRAAGQSAVVDHLDAMANGVSAVSIDEELTNLIKYQQAYAAAARVLATTQVLFDELLEL